MYAWYSVIEFHVAVVLITLFFAFMKVIGQCRRIFLPWYLFLEVYSL